MKIQNRQTPVKNLIEWLGQQIGQAGHKGIWLDMAISSQNQSMFGHPLAHVPKPCLFGCHVFFQIFTIQIFVIF